MAVIAAGSSLSGAAYGAPASSQAAIWAIASLESFSRWYGIPGFNSWATRFQSALSCDLRGTTAGPLSPPRRSASRVERSNPERLVLPPPWQGRHCVSSIGLTCVNRRGAASPYEAPALIQSAMLSTASFGSGSLLYGIAGCSWRAINLYRRLAEAFPGMIAGPRPPPRSIASRLDRSSPACLDWVLWQPRQVLAKMGWIW